MYDDMRIKIDKPLGIFETGSRSNMEDCLYPAYGDGKDTDRLFMLCDGMGGHDNGEVASATVCKTVADYIVSAGEELVTDETIGAAIEAAVKELDAKDGGGMRKMGTTMTLTCFHRGGCLAAHIGDSRIYHIRPAERRIMYKSRDHSLVYDLYMAGEISREEMSTYGKKNVITRAIMPGLDETPKADIVHITDIREGDIFYMCSDGMLEQMDDDELVELLCCGMSWEEKRQRLVELTKDNKDNHSAYIISIAGVIKEKGDEALCGDEATSRSNAVYLEAKKEGVLDVKVVSTIGNEQEAKTVTRSEETAHNVIRRTLWMVLIVVMAVVFLVVVLVKLCL